MISVLRLTRHQFTRPFAVINMSTKHRVHSVAHTQPDDDTSRRSGKPKVSVVGCGAVGMACALDILRRGCARTLALFDKDESKVQGELLDLQHGAAYLSSVEIVAGVDPAVTACSDVIVVTAGVRQIEGETRLQLVERNYQLFKHIIPPLAAASPHAVWIVVSNPCDVMTWLTAHISGAAPGRVFGSGTSLDSSRLRQQISKELHVAAHSVHAYVLGEHGDSSVPCWSSARVGGLCLGAETFGLSPDQLLAMHHEVVSAASKVIKLKGYTNWAIGAAVGRLTGAVLGDEQVVLPVSVPAKGLCGIEQDVCLSLPAILGAQGVQAILEPELSDAEKAALSKSALAIHAAQKELTL